MSRTNTRSRSPLLTTPEAAEHLALSPRTLESYRVRGVGPAYVRLGEGTRASVRYRAADLDEWVDAQVIVGGDAA
jgi:predicted DNA-binding transcriptional regulator AlpA